MTRPEPAGVGTAEEPSICVGGQLITRSDVIERLAGAGEHLGNAIAGYRDADNKRAAKGLFEAATAMLDAKALLEQQPAAITAAESRAMERCAKIVEGNMIHGRYREWPSWGTGNRGVEDDTVSLTQALARTIRSSIKEEGTET